MNIFENSLNNESPEDSKANSDAKNDDKKDKLDQILGAVKLQGDKLTEAVDKLSASILPSVDGSNNGSLQLLIQPS